MSYMLELPCLEKDRADFIVEYNHKKGLNIIETEEYLYALEPNENFVEGEVKINPNYEKEQEEKETIRIGKLTCTKRNFALMLQKLGITYNQLKELISKNEQALMEWDLCVELERSNPLLDTMAAELNIQSITLDKMFMFANGEIADFTEVISA